MLGRSELQSTVSVCCSSSFGFTKFMLFEGFTCILSLFSVFLGSQTSVDRSQPGDDRGSQEFDREETGPDPDAAQATGMSTGQPTGGPVETGDVPVSSAAKPVQVADRPVKMTTAGPIDPQPSTSTAGQEPVIMPPG